MRVYIRPEQVTPGSKYAGWEGDVIDLSPGDGWDIRVNFDGPQASGLRGCGFNWSEVEVTWYEELVEYC